MMIRDSGLLFLATLYNCRHDESYGVTSLSPRHLEFAGSSSSVMPVLGNASFKPAVYVFGVECRLDVFAYKDWESAVDKWGMIYSYTNTTLSQSLLLVLCAGRLPRKSILVICHTLSLRQSAARHAAAIAVRRGLPANSTTEWLFAGWSRIDFKPSRPASRYMFMYIVTSDFDGSVYAVDLRNSLFRWNNTTK